MNPRETAHITAVLDAISAGRVDPMKEAYQRCDATERGEMHLNAHLFVWIDHAMPDPLTRACVYGMINGRSAMMFDAVREFMRTCEAAAADATLTEIPAAMRAALRRMTFETRLSFYRMSEDAYRAKVEPLPEAIRRPVRSILRGEQDP
jgi:hypothetical protein